MSKRFQYATLFLAACCAVGLWLYVLVERNSAYVELRAQADARILLIGNGLATYGAQASILEELLEATHPEWDDVQVVVHETPGARLDYHWRSLNEFLPNPLNRYLRYGDTQWDAVVLQPQSQVIGFGLGNDERMVEHGAATKWKSFLDGKGIKTVLYMNWGYLNGDANNDPERWGDYWKMQTRLINGYEYLAHTPSGSPVAVAPVGVAFSLLDENTHRHARTYKVKLSDLFRGNKLLSEEGTTLSALVLAATIAEREIPVLRRGPENEKWLTLRRIANLATSEREPIDPGLEAACRNVLKDRAPKGGLCTQTTRYAYHAPTGTRWAFVSAPAPSSSDDNRTSERSGEVFVQWPKRFSPREPWQHIATLRAHDDMRRRHTGDADSLWQVLPMKSYETPTDHFLVWLVRLSAWSERPGGNTAGSEETYVVTCAPETQKCAVHPAYRLRTVDCPTTGDPDCTFDTKVLPQTSTEEASAKMLEDLKRPDPDR